MSDKKTYRCPACYYEGEGIVKDLPGIHKNPPRFSSGIPDSRGVYCPYCLQVWFFRNITLMVEVPKA